MLQYGFSYPELVSALNPNAHDDSSVGWGPFTRQPFGNYKRLVQDDTDGFKMSINYFATLT